MIIDILEHRRIDRALDMIHDTLDLFCLDENSLETSRRHRACREIQHITTTEEILCPDLIENGSRIDIRCDSEGNTGWDICLDESRDDIDGWSLGREDEVESDGSSLLSNSCDSSFDFLLVPTHHEVSELIDDDNDHGHSILGSDFCIVFFEVADTHRLHCAISSLHLGDSPLQGIERLVRSIDDGSQEVRDTIVDPEFDLLGIDHDHTEL